MFKRYQLFIITASLSMLANLSYAAEEKKSAQIGVINPNKILEAYPEAQKMIQELTKLEADLNKKIMLKKETLEKAKAANKTETELQLLREQMRLEIEPEAKKLEEDSSKRSAALQSKIDAAIDSVAQENKLDLVMTQEAVLYGATDVSDLVIQKLTNPSTATKATTNSSPSSTTAIKTTNKAGK